jgi:hypothetical protein
MNKLISHLSHSCTGKNNIEMQSDPWTTISTPYIARLGHVDPKVSKLVSEWSTAFDKPSFLSLADGSQYEAQRVKLTCLEYDDTIDQVQRSVLESLLLDVRTCQARTQYEKARTHFQTEMQRASSLLATWDFSQDDAATVKSRLKYVLTGCQQVVSNILDFEGTPNEKARAHLDFLHQSIRDDSLASFKNQGVEAPLFTGEQLSLLTAVQDPIQKLCKATANLYEAEHHLELNQ